LGEAIQRHEVPKSLDADSSWRSAQEQSVSDDTGLTIYHSNSPIIRHITKVAQASAALTRIFPEYVKDNVP
jgi:hypothetical protein